MALPHTVTEILVFVLKLAATWRWDGHNVSPL